MSACLPASWLGSPSFVSRSPSPSLSASSCIFIDPVCSCWVCRLSALWPRPPSQLASLASMMPSLTPSCLSQYRIRERKRRPSKTRAKTRSRGLGEPPKTRRRPGGLAEEPLVSLRGPWAPSPGPIGPSKVPTFWRGESSLFSFQRGLWIGTSPCVMAIVRGLFSWRTWISHPGSEGPFPPRLCSRGPTTGAAKSDSFVGERGRAQKTVAAKNSEVGNPVFFCLGISRETKKAHASVTRV